jgi:dGTPase
MGNQPQSSMQDFEPIPPPQPLAAIAVPDSSSDTDAGSLTARQYPEAAHPYRSPFVRDIGRILHAKSFRRLAGKTQVFTRSGAESDHSRSRLTHTLEVAQIARNTAATLGLNPSLAEALALVHDIGHPPFGHAGEQALDAALRQHNLGFDHNLHALRIVTTFEERSPAFPGLNLTLAVREGIIKHSRDYDAQDHPELAAYFLGQFPPLEAQLIDLADEIAYLSADFEDGLGAGILELEPVLENVPLVAGFFDEARRAYPNAAAHLLANEALKQMLNALVTDLMQQTVHQLREHGIETRNDLRNAPRRIAQLSPQMEENRSQAKSYLYANLYQSPALDAEHTHASEVIESLFAAWTEDPSLLPPDHQARIPEEGLPRTVADYLAGMTDAYIEQAWVKYKQR